MSLAKRSLFEGHEVWTLFIQDAFIDYLRPIIADGDDTV